MTARAAGGHFAKGNSGNPGGRRKNPAEFEAFRAKCREYSRDNFDKLTAKAEAGDVPAWGLILSYAWGRPPQPMTGEGGEGPTEIIIRRIIVEPDGTETEHA